MVAGALILLAVSVDYKPPWEKAGRFLPIAQCAENVSICRLYVFRVTFISFLNWVVINGTGLQSTRGAIIIQAQEMKTLVTLGDQIEADAIVQGFILVANFCGNALWKVCVASRVHC